MDLVNGKTIRRCLQHIPQDALLEFKCNTLLNEKISLFGHEFKSDVKYSIKKKNRWELPEKMSVNKYEDEQPIMFSKHQCIRDCEPVLDLYLYDSILGKEMGKISVSNKYLQKGSINAGSAIYQVENRLNYTVKEKMMFSKSKNRTSNARNRSRKNHRSELPYVPRPYEELPDRLDYLTEKAARENCINIREYVHVNDISKVSKICPIHRIHWETTRNNIRELKRKNKNFIRAACNEFDDFEEICEEENVSEVEVTERPFLLTLSDVLCKPEPIARKKRRKKKSISWRENYIEKVIHDSEETVVEIKENVIDLREDLLPCVVIETSLSVFVSDVLTIQTLCRCRVSESMPLVVCVDVDESVDSTLKSFLLLRVSRVEDGSAVSVRVIFNMSGREGLDYGEVCDQRFNTVRDVVSFVLARLERATTQRYSPNRKLLVLDDKVEGVVHLWKTKVVTITQSLYSQHHEWSSVVITEGVLCEMLCPMTTDGMECTVCYGDCGEGDLGVVVMSGCSHVVCGRCLSSHIVLRLESGLRDMICPGFECHGALDAATMLCFVAWKRYCKRLELLETAVIGGWSRPCSFCGAVLLPSSNLLGEPKGVEYRCACGNNVCVGCGRQRHFPTTCLEMTRHGSKMARLRDSNLAPAKMKPLIYNGRSCPKCFLFVVKNGGCNHISCSCGAHFCWGCGDLMGSGRHVVAMFPCGTVKELVMHDLTKQTMVPDPSSTRPRLYCTALHHHVINSIYYSKRFYQRLRSILDSHCSPDEAAFIQEQISEMSTILEHIFVKAYQTHRRRQTRILQFLKSYAALFIFYQSRIQAIVEGAESVRHGVKHLTSPHQRSVADHSKRLSLLVNQLQCHMARFAQFFHP